MHLHLPEGRKCCYLSLQRGLRPNRVAGQTLAWRHQSEQSTVSLPNCENLYLRLLLSTLSIYLPPKPLWDPQTKVAYTHA